jgi:hypothetical protein
MSGAVQSSEVARKYELIYGQLANAAKHQLAVARGRAEFRPIDAYDSLVMRMHAEWHLFTSGTHLDLAAPASWREFGVEKTGTVADWITRWNDLYVRLAKQHIPAGCDVLFDLGCGWGHRCVDLWLGGVDIRYICGDRPAATQRAVFELEALFPRMRLEWMPFDFLKPNLVKVPAAKVCIYTCHAIEQVRDVGATWLDRVFNIYPDADVTGIHLEPVSWQIDPARTVDRAYAERHSYNRDLMEVLIHHPDVKLVRADADVYDQGDESFATSLIVWRRKQ